MTVRQLPDRNNPRKESILLTLNRFKGGDVKKVNNYSVLNQYEVTKLFVLHKRS